MIPGDPVLRACEGEDAERVLELWKAAGVAVSLPDTADAILRRLERDRDLFVIAETDGRLVGTGDFSVSRLSIRALLVRRM